MTEVLRVEQVAKSYRRRGRETVDVLRGVNLRLREGEIRFVYGPSGSGKSTLLLCSGGLLRPDAGKVAISGEDLYALDTEERAAVRARQVGFVFQQFHLVPFLNVLDNVLAPALAGFDGDPRPRAEALIERYGLAHRRDHPPSELSIGERQRTALARAMLHNPRLLLADEPTGNLDAENGRLVMDSLAEFAASGGSVLVVTHERVNDENKTYRLEHGVLRGADGAG